MTSATVQSARPARSAVPPHGAMPDDDEARRILVIDDDARIRNIAARALGAAGFTVVQAATGDQGMGIALREPCDLVLLDLHLPDRDGEEVLRSLRLERPEQAVLIWSAAGDLRGTSRYLSQGACGYLSKPFTLAELMRATTENCKPRSAYSTAG